MAKYNITVDTSKLSYDPNNKDFVQLIEKDFPSFKNYQPESTLRNKIFAWIVLLYDINTPLRVEYRDYYDRKIKAGEMVGFKPSKKTGEFTKKVEDIFVGKDAEVNELIVDYILSFSSPDYTQLIMLFILQRQFMYDLLRGRYDGKTMQMLEKLPSRINEVTGKIYHSGDVIEVEEARKALYKKAGEDIEKLRPESIAEMLSNKEDLPGEWSPYGYDYIPDQVQFEGDDPTIEDE